MTATAKYGCSGRPHCDQCDGAAKEADAGVSSHYRRRALLRTALGVAIATPLSGCGPLYSLPDDPTFKPQVSWDEEVLLSDGRMIVVKQWRARERRLAGGDLFIVGTKASITFPALDGSKGEPVRYEGLIQPLILNVWGGTTYLAGQALLQHHFQEFGYPRTGWIAFALSRDRAWTRVSPRDIPESIRTTNLLAMHWVPEGVRRVTLGEKNSREFNANPAVPEWKLRLDPTKKASWASDWDDRILKD